MLNVPQVVPTKRRVYKRFRCTTRIAGWHPSLEARAGSKYYAMNVPGFGLLCSDTSFRVADHPEVGQTSQYKGVCQY